MSDALLLSSLRDEAFRSIGRNVLLFQSLERHLKFILNRGRVSGTPAQIQAAIDNLAGNSDRRTLGQMVDAFVEQHLSVDNASEESPPGPGCLWIAVHITFPLGTKQRKELEEMLEQGLRARNDLIHHSIEWLRLDSLQGCQDTVRRLKDLERETQSAVDRVREMVSLMRELAPRLAKELRRAIENLPST